MIFQELKMPDEIARMFPQLRDLFGKCIVPIYYREGGNPGLEGTGTLFRIAEESFLVTAAHVVTGRTETAFYITDGVAGSEVIPLSGRLFISDDRFDVAVWPLSDAVVAELSSRQFLRLSDVEFSPTLQPGLFAIHGFPHERHKFDPKTGVSHVQAFTHVGGLYSGTEELRTYDPQFHVLLHMDRNDVLTEDGSRPDVPSSLKGISGCSLWQVCRKGESLADWKPTMARVVAVETRVHKSDESIVQGTRWHAVMVLLWKQHPAVRRALALYLPEPLRT